MKPVDFLGLTAVQGASVSVMAQGHWGIYQGGQK